MVHSEHDKGSASGLFSPGRLILAGLIILFAAAALGLALRPDATVFLKPLSEDGYYAMTIARNMAQGRGITIDGSRLTNGFQPLFTFIQAGLFRLSAGNDLLAIRYVLLAHWLILVATALFVGAIASNSLEALDPAERRCARILGIALYLAGGQVFLVSFNGLETGLLLLLIALAWRLYQLGLAETIAGAAAFGALLGLAVLARIDAGFLVASLCLAELWHHRGAGFFAAWRAPIVIGLAALVVSGPWWLFNTIAFGSPMPISGTAQQLWTLDPTRWRWLGWALSVTSMPWLFGGIWEGRVVEIGRAIVILLGAVALLRAWRAPHGVIPVGPVDGARAARSRRFARALLAGLVGLALWYGLSSFAYWFYSRYLMPAALLGVVYVAALLARPLSGHWCRASALVAVLGAPVVVFAVMSWSGNGPFGTIMFWDQVRLVRERVPDGDAVAAGQSGTLGFFRPDVVNVDGKVNPDIRAYAGRIPAYLAARGVRWFCDWPYYVEKALGPDPEKSGWTLVTSRDGFFLYHRAGD